MVTYLRDLTDHYGRQRELEEALASLRQSQQQMVQSEKMASLGVLTAGIAHEINNPINFVSATVEPLRRDIEDVLSLLRVYEGLLASTSAAEVARAEQQRLDMDTTVTEITQLLQGLEDGARRTVEIVRGLRQFTRLDEAAMKPCRLEDGLESTLALLGQQYADRIVVHRDFGDLPDVEWHPGQINQVFMNLLVNAISAISGPGEIRIRMTAEDELVRISISDTGSGIPPAILPHIFDPFFYHQAGGSGLGSRTFHQLWHYAGSQGGSGGPQHPGAGHHVYDDPAGSPAAHGPRGVGPGDRLPRPARPREASVMSEERTRSWLLTSAADPSRCREALGAGADQVIWDLEDTVSQEQKPRARQSTIELLATLPAEGQKPWVRVNHPQTPEGREDVAALKAVRHDRWVIPKVDNGTVALLGRWAVSGAMVLLIESAQGLWDLRQAAWTPLAGRPVRLGFGSLDFRADLGLEVGDGEEELKPARAELVLASRVFGWPAPLDGVYPSNKHRDGLEAAATASRRQGFAGKLTLDPRHIAKLNAVFDSWWAL